jgi:DNA polymerase-3 subunit epsilon
MTNLQKCSKCKSEQELKYFSINKKGQLYKTCDNCRNKRLQSSSDKSIIVDAINLMHKTSELLQRVVKEKNEKPIMIFDVEHTGCFETLILQLSWGLYKHDGTLIEMKDYFLNPAHELFIHPRAVEIHKISYSLLITKPNSLEISELLNTFMADVLKCETLISHNIKCDLKTLNRELLRNDMTEINVNTYCTMAETKQFCNSKDKINRIKFPTLNELHQKLFDCPIDKTKAHNSCYDVEMCANCYFKFKNINS